MVQIFRADAWLEEPRYGAWDGKGRGSAETWGNYQVKRMMEHEASMTTSGNQMKMLFKLSGKSAVIGLHLVRITHLEIRLVIFGAYRTLI